VAEAGPGIPDSPAFATPERAELAGAIRELIDAAMSLENVAPDVLLEVAQKAGELASQLGAPRTAGSGYVHRDHGDYLPRSPVVGEASPLSPRLDWEVHDEDGRTVVEAHGVFGAAYEGPPSYVHGGWIACTFDEILGIANIASGQPGMTGRLTIHYRRPTPLFRELRVRAWVDRVEGRRVLSRAEMFEGDTLTAEADGVFIQPRPELAEQYWGPRDD
jgi:Thioesterase superfamily